MIYIRKTSRIIFFLSIELDGKYGVLEKSSLRSNFDVTFRSSFDGIDTGSRGGARRPRTLFLSLSFAPYPYLFPALSLRTTAQPLAAFQGQNHNTDSLCNVAGHPAVFCILRFGDYRRSQLANDCLFMKSL